jgi:hypothetical protein
VEIEKKEGVDPMTWLGRICFLVLASGVALAQNAQNSGPAGATSVADELKALHEAMAQQQQQIAQQQQQIDTLKKALDEKNSGTPHVEDAALHTNAPTTADVVQGEEKPKESPLSFRIGGTEFTPGGFVDFENVFRTTNTGNNISTSFQTIPFSTVPAGHLTEFRTTGQYSRFNLRITGKYGPNDVTGYIEADFNGNDATNVFTTSNPHTNRLRLYWLDLKRGRWEFLGGQSWSLMTPNRVGLSPNPADLLITYNEDSNIQVGLTYTRAGQFRAVRHFSDNFQWGWGIENGEQFISTATFPSGFATAATTNLNGQFNPTNNSNGTPNVGPDLVSKLALDGNPGGRHMHVEVGGIMTSAKITFTPTVAGATFQHDSHVGVGIQGAFVLSMTKNFRLVGSGMWGTGIGRYFIGTGPQVVVAPSNFNGAVCASTVGCGLRLSPIHAGTGLVGLELQATPKTLFGAYYGAAYFQRNFFPDLTSPAAVKPFVGYGGPGVFAVTSTQNRAIQEATLDWTQTFWRNPQYGAVILITQYSYLTRAPWFVPLGEPKNAHLSMAWLSVRYILP